MTVGDRIRETVATLDGVDLDGTVVHAGTETIAVLAEDGSWAEFRLDPAVAAAARRTPDTGASERGPDWVRFSPATLDPHAIDRAVAWLGSAARRARG